MFRFVMPALAGVVVGAAIAADGNALHTDGCRAALDRLGAQEARQASAPASGRQPALKPALQQAQRAAADACLGGADDPAPRPPPTQPVPALQPRAPLAVPRVAAPPPSPVGPAVVVPPPPAFVTACDATGCWGSDGRRLDRVGPDLYYRDRRLCQARGGTLHCP